MSLSRVFWALDRGPVLLHGGGDDGRVRGWNLCVAGDAATLAYVRARVDGAFLTMELPGPLADNAAFSALLLERDVSGAASALSRAEDTHP